MREEKRRGVTAKAELAAEERLLDALVGKNASAATRDSFRKKLRDGELDEKEVELEVSAGQAGMPMFELPGIPGASVGAISIGDMLGKALGQRSKTRRVQVREGRGLMIADESDKLLDSDAVVQEALREVENNGIVFLDEIDKICAREGRGGADISREGVQRDLLPLLEGTTVATKHGTVKTDHILFIASGAFHLSKPSDLLPELQGRLPIRVELLPLEEADFVRILTETEASLIKQSVALLATEGVSLRLLGGFHRGDRASRLRGERSGREHRSAAPADDHRARARRDLPSPRPTAPARPSRSMRTTCASASPISPRIRTRAASCCEASTRDRGFRDRSCGAARDFASANLSGTIGADMSSRPKDGTRDNRSHSLKLMMTASRLPCRVMIAGLPRTASSTTADRLAFASRISISRMPAPES